MHLGPSPPAQRGVAGPDLSTAGADSGQRRATAAEARPGMSVAMVDSELGAGQEQAKGQSPQR